MILGNVIFLMKNSKIVIYQTQEQEKLGKLITNVNLMTSQLELHYFEDTDTDIVIRAREMSEMVSEMYLFTRYALCFTA